MTVTSIAMATALQDLERDLVAPGRPGAPPGSRRWAVRQRMGAVRDALVAETGHGGEGWLAAREVGLLRERNALLGRLAALGPQVLESQDVDEVRAELHRLLVDVSHHAQRRRDLAYDEVGLELGGSE